METGPLGIDGRCQTGRAGTYYQKIVDLIHIFSPVFAVVFIITVFIITVFIVTVFCCCFYRCSLSLMVLCSICIFLVYHIFEKWSCSISYDPITRRLRGVKVQIGLHVVCPLGIHRADRTPSCPLGLLFTGWPRVRSGRDLSGRHRALAP